MKLSATADSDAKSPHTVYQKVIEIGLKWGHDNELGIEERQHLMRAFSPK